MVNLYQDVARLSLIWEIYWPCCRRARRTRAHPSTISHRAIFDLHNSLIVLSPIPSTRTHARTHAVLKITAKEDRCIVHFMHPDFRTCEVMAGHLRLLARQHFRTRFYFFNADKGRWVSSKLKVRTLPAVLMFIGGVCKDRIEGFEELGNNEGFSTKTLEARLAKSGVISLGSENAAAAGSSRIFGFAKKKKEDGDDSDDD